MSSSFKDLQREWARGTNDQIKRLYQSGVPATELAVRFGKSLAVIQALVKKSPKKK
jgi:hypothetical protein